MSSVAIIDYGMGNLHSIAKAIQHVAPEVVLTVTSDPKKILDADRVVLPGVGAIKDCMNALEGLDLIPVLRNVTATKPFLGICLGLHALLDESEENNGTSCLGIIPGKVVRFNFNQGNSDSIRLKIPHMGWNCVHQQNLHPLWNNIAQDSRFYFVHSYYAKPATVGDISAVAGYGDQFACSLRRDNIFAVQFHPEKSQAAGLQLLRNFVDWNESG